MFTNEVMYKKSFLAAIYNFVCINHLFDIILLCTFLLFISYLLVIIPIIM